ALACAIFVVAVSAHAHRINLLVLPEGDVVRGRVYYADGSPAAHAEVEVRRAGGDAATVTADEAGAFVVAREDDGAITFVVETADGHRAETTLEGQAVETPDAVTPESSGSIEPNVRRIVQQELAPIRAMLVHYEEKTRFRDILGGIGYIVGVVGLMAWWKSRSRRSGS